jgi:hypothetical protein
MAGKRHAMGKAFQKLTLIIFFIKGVIGNESAAGGKIDRIRNYWNPNLISR